MDQVREVLRYHHYAYRTEQTYCDWIKRYQWVKGSVNSIMLSHLFRPCQYNKCAKWVLVPIFSRFSTHARVIVVSSRNRASQSFRTLRQVFQ